MSFVQFLRILAARKAIILATLIACFFAATVTVFLLPPRYEAHNRVRVDITKPDPLTGQMSQQMMNAYLGTQVNLITDVQTAGLVVDELWSWNVVLRPVAAWRRRKSTGSDLDDLHPLVNLGLRAIITAERYLPVTALPGVSLMLRAHRPIEG